MRSCTFLSSYSLKLATSDAERYIQFSEEQLEQVRIPEEDTDRVLLASQLAQKTMRFSRVLFTPTSSQRPSFSQCFLFICPFSPSFEGILQASQMLVPRLHPEEIVGLRSNFFLTSSRPSYVNIV